MIIFYIEYFVYHLAKIFSIVLGAILIYTLVMKFGKEVEYFLLGKTYIQFEMLDNVIEIPEKSILLFINVTEKEEVLTRVRETCFNTTCLCVIRFEKIEYPVKGSYEKIYFKTKYIKDNEVYVIKVKPADFEWMIYNNSYPQVFGTIYDDYSPQNNTLYTLLNLNSRIICREVSKKFYLNYTIPHVALVAIVNPSDNKPLKLFVSYEKVGDKKYLIMINELVSPEE